MPLSVLLSADVMREINHAIADAGDDQGRGREIGGILLGRIDYTVRSKPVVRVEGVDPVESEHRRGASFALTDRDKRELGRRLAAWNRGQRELRPVGFYRSHTRRGLYLDNEDFALVQAYFPERDSVVLLVRPEQLAANAGGFFFWEEGDMHRESSLQEFPFDPARATPTAPAQPPTPLPEALPPVAARPRLNWALAAIPLAALLFAVSFYTVWRFTPAHRAVAMNSPDAARVEIIPMAAPAPVAAPVPAAAPPPVVEEKPSPSQPKRAPRSPLTQARRNTPATVPDTPAASALAPSTTAPVPEPASTTPVASAAPVAPAPPLAPIDTPVRTLPPPRRATVTVEPVNESRITRVVSKIPGLHKLDKKGHGYIPARPIQEVRPTVPGTQEMASATPVDLKVTVDPAGRVTEIFHARGNDPRLVELASDAARHWRFEPARRNQDPVECEMLLHFNFRPVAGSAANADRMQ